MARQFGVRVSSIYLVCPLELALQRNSKRRGKENVPDFVVKIYYRRLQPPTLEEGFDSVEVYGVGNENSTKTKQSIA
jgi:tRNA uridine 5-carbamoylmethylation protein Kti12